MATTTRDPLADPCCPHCGGSGIEFDCGGYENTCYCTFTYTRSGSVHEVLTRTLPKDQPCPTCGAANALDHEAAARGYQCNACAQAGKGW